MDVHGNELLSGRTAAFAPIRGIRMSICELNFSVLTCCYVVALFLLLLLFRWKVLVAAKAQRETSVKAKGVMDDPLWNALLVYVVKTKSGDMVMLLRRRNGKAPFLYYTYHYLRRNKGFTKSALLVDCVMDQFVEAGSDAHTKQSTPEGTCWGKNRYVVLVRLMPKDAKDSNTFASRRNWADLFINYFNHPNNQAMYTYPMTACFAGDLTPKNNDECLQLSTYLMIGDTASLAKCAAGGKTDGESVQPPLPSSDCLNDV